MKRKILISASAILALMVAAIAYSNILTTRSTSNVSNPPPYTITVRVTQQPDICGVEDPCFCNVLIKNTSGDTLGGVQYSGPGYYYPQISGSTSGWIIATVEQDAGNINCTCTILVTSDSQNGPPYDETMNVHIQ